jgi:hypothetical protein
MAARRKRPWRGWVALPLAATLGLSAAPPARGQAADASLLGLLARRSLHARVALADAVAVASVERVDPGRVRLREARALVGAVPDAFELKRAPSSPPPLAAGERALLLLRGARSPYLLVDGPAELQRLPDPASEERWRRAVESLVAARADPPALLALTLSWLDPRQPDLAQAAVLGLGDPATPFQPLPAGALLRLARFARDASAPPELRRAAQFVAGRSLAGREELLARSPDLRRELERLARELP